MTTFTNGMVAIRKILVIDQLAVLCEGDSGEQQWVLLSSLDRSEFGQVVKLIDNNPTFPWKEELDELIADRKAS